MDDSRGCLSVVIIIVFLLCSLVGWFSFSFGKASIQEQAIKRGYAERIAGDDGNVIFKWKKVGQ